MVIHYFFSLWIGPNFYISVAFFYALKTNFVDIIIIIIIINIIIIIIIIFRKIIFDCTNITNFNSFSEFHLVILSIIAYSLMFMENLISVSWTILLNKRFSLTCGAAIVIATYSTFFN